MLFFFLILPNQPLLFNLDGLATHSDVLELLVHLLLVNVPLQVEHRRLDRTVRLRLQNLFEPVQELQTQVVFLLGIEQSCVEDAEVTHQSDMLLFFILDDAPHSRELASDQSHEGREVDVVDSLVDQVKVAVVGEGVPDEDEISRTVELVVGLESQVHDGAVFGLEESFDSVFFDVVVDFEGKLRFGNQTENIFNFRSG